MPALHHSCADHLRRRSTPVITSIAADAKSPTHPWRRHYGQHYGQNDACSWGGIMPGADAIQNVGAEHRLRTKYI
jgi:hypothetical protein